MTGPWWPCLAFLWKEVLSLRDTCNVRWIKTCDSKPNDDPCIGSVPHQGEVSEVSEIGVATILWGFSQKLPSYRCADCSFFEKYRLFIKAVWKWFWNLIERSQNTIIKDWMFVLRYFFEKLSSVLCKKKLMLWRSWTLVIYCWNHI